ncbi:hypothetical protein B0T25DRAFT_589631 [Lasiosphaeria hispida]|uniref:Transcription factor tau subunit sfc4 n=1 Tax=Lasiosphaeria hispida TaxID=260671 RepID=A0AAJ0MG33_9PEZI|nr:hypothetical protein B0T25DRAFT_589631 [Lasiosphaeria hispida]
MADRMNIDSTGPVDPRLTGHYAASMTEHDAISNASSDELELQANVARHDAQREAFIAQQRSDASSQPQRPQPGPPAVKFGARPHRKGRKLGPRKAAKPTPDILFRLSLAREAFERKDYEDAIKMIKEIIRINSETYNAWTLLSTVHEELGDREKAIMCLMTAAHLVPKNIASWLHAASYALQGVEDMDDGPEKDTALERALTCYSHVLTNDKSSIEARTGKADVLMMQGHAGQALAQYQKALEYRPLNIRTVRNTADVALDARDAKKGAEVAKRAYRNLIDHLQSKGTVEAEEGRFEWSDLRIYLEFFTILEQWHEGTQQLKGISRWLLGRRAELFWDRWADDDREWDLHDDRRVQVPEFEPAQHPQDTYGQGLPIDLRARLFVYRRKLGHEYEAMLHLRVLDPADDSIMNQLIDFPDCLKDIAVALIEGEQAEEALRYINLYKQIAGMNGEITVDADVLVTQGRCHMLLGDKSAAEECFIAAIEDDQDHIEARIQLANMYEGEQEQEGREEAFLLVRQALNLEASGTGERKKGRRRGPYGPRKPREKKEGQKERKSKYVPRRLINAEKRKQQDLEMTEVAGKNYQAMQEVRDRVVEGDEHATETWMKAAKDLIDDFRSYKEFYPWEKYIKYLGYGGTVISGQSSAPARSIRLAAMAERLQQNLAPAEGQEMPPRLPAKIPQEHRGIPFDQWLDVFLEYAFSLVRAGKHREAYVVCHAARDSIIWSAIEHTFLIHVAWASCAVYAGDEETCVAIARYFMRDYMPGTDSYRMFAAMCRVCQTPVSWYTSGPAQKFILRQIKTMDNIQLKVRSASEEGQQREQGENEGRVQPQQQPGQLRDIGLDICLLTIYGHILFSTTSYAYALSYFARAASLDPHNCLVNLSSGLAYLHYALKRQATNRQYLLTQAFAFLFRYYDDRLHDPQVTRGERQEAHFNIARAYSLIGLGNLAVDYYKKVLAEAEGASWEGVREEGVLGNEDLTLEAAYNIRTTCYLLGDVEGAKAVTERWLVLE